MRVRTVRAQISEAVLSFHLHLHTGFKIRVLWLGMACQALVPVQPNHWHTIIFWKDPLSLRNTLWNISVAQAAHKLLHLCSLDLFELSLPVSAFKYWDCRSILRQKAINTNFSLMLLCKFKINNEILHHAIFCHTTLVWLTKNLNISKDYFTRKK